MKQNFKYYFFCIIYLYSSILFAKCNNVDLLAIDDPESLNIINPSAAKVTMYDPLLDDANVMAYETHAKNSGNLGLGAFDWEVLIFDKVNEDKINLCAYVEYGRLYETQKVGFNIAGLNSFIRAKKFFEICPPTDAEKRFPYYDHVCNFWPEDGKSIQLSKKNKGTKGAHSNAFVYSSSTFQHTNGSLLECIGFGTLFNSNYPGYFTEAVMGKICTDQLDYFNIDKIKKLAQSVGVYGTAEPTKDLRLSFHK